VKVIGSGAAATAGAPKAPIANPMVHIRKLVRVIVPRNVPLMCRIFPFCSKHDFRTEKTRFEKTPELQWF
jgi:hypothetical protein